MPNRAGGSVPGAPMGRSKSPEGVPDALKRVPGEPEALFQMPPRGRSMCAEAHSKEFRKDND